MKQINSKYLFAKAMGEEVPELTETDVQGTDKSMADTKEALETTSAVVEPPQKEKHQPTEANTDAVTVEESSSKKNYRWLWVFLGLVMLVGAFLLGKYWPFDNSSDMNTVGGEPTPTNTSIADNPVVPYIDTVRQDTAMSILSVDTAVVVQTQDSGLSVNNVLDSLSLKLEVDFFNQRRWFIGCFAMRREAKVLAKIEKIKAKGFDNVHYYWIPDVIEGGNRFFKIVIGPFESSTQAKAILDTVRLEVNPEAHLLKVKRTLSVE